MGQNPRWIKAGIIYAQTQRTVDRQFLFKPDLVITNIIGASAARAQASHPVHIYWIEFNINHEHCGIGALSDSQEHLDNLIRFKQTFHRLVAREINEYLGREGALFSSPSRDCECLDDQSLEQQFFYALTNPVKDGLVDKVKHWKGISSWQALANGKNEYFTYFDKTAWHKAGGKSSGKAIQAFAKRVCINYTPLPSMQSMSQKQRQTYIRRQCEKLENHFRELRQRTTGQVVGSKRLARLDHRQRPATRAVRTRKPLCHASTQAAAKEYKDAYRRFACIQLCFNPLSCWNVQCGVSSRLH